MNTRFPTPSDKARNADPMSRRHFLLLGVGGLTLATGFAWWRAGPGRTRAVTLAAEPTGVMGTTARLLATADDPQVARSALLAAEARLRRVEALMSTYLADSEISRLNSAPTGRLVPLSPETRAVLEAARACHRATDGTFDVTIRPLERLWARATDSGRQPRPDEIHRARAASSWEHFEFTGHGIRKSRNTSEIDLGGIAKGYGVDQALEAIRLAGASGALVEVGGDVRAFGSPSGDEFWSVAVRDPRSGGTARTLRINDGSVCTSGDYARGLTFRGRRLSHIIDPVSGLPLEGSPSVTVQGTDAMAADAWATAASVTPVGTLRNLPSSFSVLST